MAQVASKFGRYEIKAELGRGGMATVYKAYDPTFQREVAIKVLPAEFLHEPQFRERFMREARLVALLEHPAIIPVYDFGEQDNQPYIVMRLMGGGSLADRIHKGPLPVPSVVQILNNLAPALDAAHARGIVHRDLKPANILFDDYGNPFISDFGIAHITQSASSFTLTGNGIIGTPAYMSLEQIQGDKDLDGRSDIYAMGVILFQMLTGTMPYHSDTPAKVMIQHLMDPIPSPRATKADVPPMFDAVISHAMAKDRTQRFAKASEMATLVQRAGKASMPSDTSPAPRNVSATVLAPDPRPRPSGQASPPQTSSQGARPVTAAAQRPIGGMQTVAGGPPSGVYPVPGGPSSGTHLPPPPPPPGGRGASAGPEPIAFRAPPPRLKNAIVNWPGSWAGAGCWSCWGCWRLACC